MVQYIAENALSFGIGIAFIISTLLLGIIFLFQANKHKNHEKHTRLVFSFSLFLFSAAHIIWTIRAANLPRFASPITFFPYWQGFWILFMLGITFIGIWGIFLNYSHLLANRKWIVLVLFIPWILVTLDVLLLTNPSTTEIVCSALIHDFRPDLFVILATGISLVFFSFLVIDYYYQQFKVQENKLLSFLTLFGLILILLGGLLDSKPIPICQFITLGRILMLIGFWLTSIGIIKMNPVPKPI